MGGILARNPHDPVPCKVSKRDEGGHWLEIDRKYVPSDVRAVQPQAKTDLGTFSFQNGARISVLDQEVEDRILELVDSQKETQETPSLLLDILNKNKVDLTTGRNEVRGYMNGGWPLLEVVISRAIDSLPLTKALYDYCPRVYTRQHALRPKNREVFNFLADKLVRERIDAPDFRIIWEDVLKRMQQDKETLEDLASLNRWLERETKLVIKQTTRPYALQCDCFTQDDCAELCRFWNTTLGVEASAGFRAFGTQVSNYDMQLDVFITKFSTFMRKRNEWFVK